MTVLDVGCGNNPLEGAIGLDVRTYPRVDLVGDGLNLPFKDGTFRRVNASQLLEHLDGRSELPDLFEEVYRVLERGGLFTFDVPIGEAWSADPTHETQWRLKTVVYFLTREEVARLGWDHGTFPDYYGSRDFHFDLEEWNCDAWLWADSLPLRACSFCVEKASAIVETDKWAAVPLGAGNLNVTLRKTEAR